MLPHLTRESMPPLRAPLAAVALLVTGSCAPSSIPEEQLVCETTGRIATDEEYILGALKFHFEADEMLREMFPPGTAPGRYQGYGSGPEDFRSATWKPLLGEGGEPPFVPGHFRQFKARAQQENPRATKNEVAENYLEEFPKCCRALSPRWARGGWSENIHYTPYRENGGEDRWIRDVWVIDKDIENADKIWLDESRYMSGSLDRNEDLKRFLFREISQRGDLASTQCAEAFYVTR